jgi:hypothetical protein
LSFVRSTEYGRKAVTFVVVSRFFRGIADEHIASSAPRRIGYVRFFFFAGRFLAGLSDTLAGSITDEMINEFSMSFSTKPFLSGAFAPPTRTCLFFFFAIASSKERPREYPSQLTEDNSARLRPHPGKV